MLPPARPPAPSITRVRDTYTHVPAPLPTRAFAFAAGYTSVAQFVANILYTPVLLDLYGTLLADKPLLYVLLFPCNVWWLEVVVAYVLIWLYGHNVAWCYDDYSDAFCHASFRLGHGLFWLGLGAICLHLYPLLIETTDSAAAWVEAELSLQGHDAKWL